LGTGITTQAIRRSRIVAAEFEAMLSGAEGIVCETTQTPVVVSPVAQPIRTISEATPPTPPERNLRDLLNVYLTDPTRSRSKKTEITYENVLAVVGEVLGLDTPLKAIDRESCRRLLETLRWLPTNYSKRVITWGNRGADAFVMESTR
jgi:hypothetical protein